MVTTEGLQAEAWGKTRSSYRSIRANSSRAAPWGVAGSQCCTSYPTLWGGSACLTEFAWIAFALREGRQEMVWVTQRAKGSRNPCRPRPNPPAPRDRPRWPRPPGLRPLPSRSKSLRKEASFRFRSALVLATRLPPFLDGAMALRWRLRGARGGGTRRQRRDGEGEGAARGRERPPNGVWMGTPALPGLGIKDSRGTHLQVLIPGLRKNLVALPEKQRLGTNATWDRRHQIQTAKGWPIKSRRLRRVS